jgi:Zn-dependent protease
LTLIRGPALAQSLLTYSQTMAASTENSTRQTPGLRLATIGGVPVYIGRSWPIIAVVIVAIYGPSVANSRPDIGAVGAYAVGVGFALLLLVAVLAHEAAHAVLATRLGYRVNRVVADLMGGHTAYDSVTERPGVSALVAVAGPAANAGLALAGWLAQDAVPEGVPSVMVGATFYINASLAAFNLLPGLPLDGGYLVESLVWRATGSRERGLIAAGWCGRAVTVLVVLWFAVRPLLEGQRPDLFSMGWVFYIGFFLWMGAGNAIRSGRGGRLLAGIRIDSVWRRATSLPAQASVANALVLRDAGPGGPGGTAVVVEDEQGNAIGLLDEEALARIPEQSRDYVSVTAAMHRQPDGWVVEAAPHESITTVVVAMQTLGIGAVPVRGPDGRIVGIVLAGDLQAALSRRAAP